MARSVELTPPPRRTSPHEEGIRAVNPSPAAAQPPAKRVLRLSTRAQTPSQQRSLSWALVKEPTATAATTLSGSLSPAMTAEKTPPATTTTIARQKKSRRVASEPMLSKLYTSRTATREQQVNLSPLAASAGSRRTFDFHRATTAALASSSAGQFPSPPRSQGTQPHVAPTSPSPAAAVAHYHQHHLNKKTNNNRKKTRTPRKAPSNVAAHPHPPSLVKNMLGLAARAVKAFSIARGRRRSLLLAATADERDKLLLTKRRSGLEPEWIDDDAHDDGQETEEKPRQSPRTKVSPKATGVGVKKRTRVSNGSARSRLAREEEAETVRSPLESAPPRTPRIGTSTTTSRRPRVGAATTSSSAKRHPSSSGGGASTFRASSSRKRVRVGGGRPSLSGSVSGRTIYPSSVLSPSAILNRARPVSRSEALVGEYTARAILRSSVNGGGGGANDLLRSSTRSTTTSYHYYRPRTGEIGSGETEEEEEDEWVEEARIDGFGAALPALGHDAQIRESETWKHSYVAHLDRQQGARGRFSRSLAPSPISVWTVVRNPVHSRAVINSDEKQQLPSTRNSSVLSLRDLSHCAVADESQLPDEEEDEDNSASSPLSAFVRQLAKASAAQSSSQDGDVEDFSAGGDGGGGLDSPTPTSTSESEAARPFSSSSALRAFRLPEWLPFASAATEWTRDQSSEDENGDEEAAQVADEDPLPSPFEDASEDVSEAGEEAGAGPNAATLMRLRAPPPPGRRGPTASPLVFPCRQVDSADLASARLVGARRLSRELATTASLAAVLKRDGGNGSAPVSPTTFGEDGPLHGGSSSPPIETTYLPEFGSANATGSGGGIGCDLSQETLRPSSPSSSRLPSLSPVSPFKFRFSSESSPAAAAAAEDATGPSPAKTTTPPPPTGPSEDLRRTYRELTRRSADFALPSSPSASHISAAAMHETALEVFGRVLPAATHALPSSSGAASNSQQQKLSLALRRTIRPGDGASLGRNEAAGDVQKKKQKNGGAWEIYRNEVIDESYAKRDDGSPASRSAAAETSEAEAGVLAERTEASMLRKLATGSRRGGGARARFGTQPAAGPGRSGNSAEEEAEGEKENVRGYFSA